MTMTIRLATADDVAVLVPLMEAAIQVLQKGYIRTGTFCSYVPDVPVSWHIADTDR